MHILLTDVLTCPRCGPEFGLILLADQMVERRVLEGWLGCANCRERFRVTGGFADLRSGTAEPPATEPPVADALKIAALLGVTEGPGLLLVAGPAAQAAAAIADLIPAIEVVAAWAALANEAERAGVSRLATTTGLPIRSGSIRGVAITGPTGREAIAEAARVAAHRARVVVVAGGADVVEWMTSLGLRMLAHDESAAVAERA